MTSTGRMALRLDLAGLLVLVLAALIVGLLDVRVLGFVAFLALAAIVAGGVFAAVAIVRDGERSFRVFAALVPAAFALFLMIGELALPH